MQRETQRLTVYDGWRGVAVLLVLVGHYFNAHIPGYNLGRLGIEMFFVLSGALMAKILFIDKQSFRTFAARRFSRIYPALFVFCVVLFALSFVLEPLKQISGSRDILGALSLTFNIPRGWAGDNSGPMANVWSVCVEVQSYLALAIVALLTRRSARSGIVVLGLIAIAMMALGALLFLAIGPSHFAVYWRSEVRMSSVFVGAISFLVINGIRGSPHRFTPLAFLIAGVALQVATVPDPIKYTLGTTCLAVALVLLPRTKGHLAHGLSSPPLLFFGLISYSLYLWQFPLLFSPGNKAMLMGGAVVLATFSFYAVERPARHCLNRWFDNLARKRAPRPDGIEARAAVPSAPAAP